MRATLQQRTGEGRTQLSEEKAAALEREQEGYRDVINSLQSMQAGSPPLDGRPTATSIESIASTIEPASPISSDKYEPTDQSQPGHEMKYIEDNNVR